MKFMNKGEEKAITEDQFNSMSHGIGAFLALASIPLMIITGPKTGMSITSTVVYGLSLIVLYIISSLYHAVSEEKLKKVLKILDHSTVYLLMAGTYTPFCVIFLKDTSGWMLLVLVWLLALTGSVSYAVFGPKARFLYPVTYIIMALVIVGAVLPLVEILPEISIILLLAGCFAYTIGFAFYIQKNVKWAHSVYHIMVLTGSILHFFCLITAFILKF